MKQRISIDQLNELSEEQKVRLREWWKPEEGDVILLTRTVGFFEKGSTQVVNYIGNWAHTKDVICFGGGDTGEGTSKEKCFPLLSIGQMIELLHDKHGEMELEVKNGRVNIGLDFCDRLFKSVKAYL